MRRHWAALGAALMMVAVLAGPASAAPGDLDSSFGGGDGQATAKFLQGSSSAEAMALQSGGIVAAGYLDLSSTNVAWALTRFTPSGVLDTTFGNGGRVVTDWTPGDDEAWGIVVLGNGKIVVAGFAGGSFAVARYTASGHLDHTFGGGDGKATADFTPNHDQAWDVVKAPGGKVVLVGQAGPSSHPVVAVARFDSSGKLDAGFSGDGKATEDVFGGPSLAWDALARPDGSVIVTGQANGGSFDDVMVTKFTDAGHVDGSFGDTGAWEATTPDNAYANAIVRLASGKLMVVAAVGDNAGGFDVGLFRFDSNGHEDDSFGTSGLVATDFGSDEFPTDMQRAGSKLVISMRRIVSGQPGQMGVARMLGSGAPDAGFGDGGLATASLPNASGEALAIQSNGRIVAAGGSRKTAKDRFAVARFLAA
jgi:uncharacterized delta-60 repeat protein